MAVSTLGKSQSCKFAGPEITRNLRGCLTNGRDIAQRGGFKSPHLPVKTLSSQAPGSDRVGRGERLLLCSKGKQHVFNIWRLLLKKPPRKSPQIIRRAQRPIEPIFRPLDPKEDFYASEQWRTLRFEALQKYGRQCQCCGRRPPAVVLHVDHIKPRSRYPQLQLQLNNLQILCEDCNLGKSNKSSVDFRKR